MTIDLDELRRKGRRVPKLDEDTVREVGLHSYRILYEIKPDHLIEVLAVIHKRQQVEADEIQRDQYPQYRATVGSGWETRCVP